MNVIIKLNIFSISVYQRHWSIVAESVIVLPSCQYLELPCPLQSEVRRSHEVGIHFVLSHWTFFISLFCSSLFASMFSLVRALELLERLNTGYFLLKVSGNVLIEVSGLVLSTVLLCNRRFSSAQFGTYKHLLTAFAITDIFLVVQHAIVSVHFVYNCSTPNCWRDNA